MIEPSVRLGAVSAGLYGLAALLALTAPEILDSSAGWGRLAESAAIGALPAMLWGYVAGRFHARQRHVIDWLPFILVGMGVTIAAAISGGVMVGSAVAFDDSEVVLGGAEALLLGAVFGFLQGVLASPFGMGAGFLLWRAARRSNHADGEDA